MREEDLMRKARRFKSLITSPYHPYFPDILDAIIDELPPLRINRIAEKLGITGNMAARYIRWIKEYGHLTLRYYPSAIGLGAIIALLKHSQLKPPKSHWLYSATETFEGIIISYRYPLVLGHEFITEELRNVTEWIHVYPYAISIQAKTKYFLEERRILNSVEALVKAIEDARPIPINLPVNKRPRDLLDLFLLAILESNASLNYIQIAEHIKKKLNVKFPYRKIRMHLLHLMKDKALAGFAFRSIVESPYSTMIFFEAESRNQLYELINTFLNYPYAVSLFFNLDTYEALVLVYVAIKNLPQIIRILKEYVGMRFKRLVFFSIESRLAKYTLPFRNYDPFKKAWVQNPVDIDKWLRKRGYVLEKSEEKTRAR